MNKKLPIEIPYDKITAFCKKWDIAEFAFFGSVLRDDFRSDSDIDILITYMPNACRTLFDHVEMQDELKEIFGRNVDLVSKRGVEQSRNRFRRKEILETAEVVYAVA